MEAGKVEAEEMEEPKEGEEAEEEEEEEEDADNDGDAIVVCKEAGAGEEEEDDEAELTSPDSNAEDAAAEDTAALAAGGDTSHTVGSMALMFRGHSPVARKPLRMFSGENACRMLGEMILRRLARVSGGPCSTGAEYRSWSRACEKIARFEYDLNGPWQVLSRGAMNQVQFGGKRTRMILFASQYCSTSGSFLELWLSL